jgi:hypothetical protein
MEDLIVLIHVQKTEVKALETNFNVWSDTNETMETTRLSPC